MIMKWLSAAALLSCAVANPWPVSAASPSDKAAKPFDPSLFDFRLGMSMREVMDLAKRKKLHATYQYQALVSMKNGPSLKGTRDPLPSIEITPVLGSKMYIAFSHVTKLADTIELQAVGTDEAGLLKAGTAKWGSPSAFDTYTRTTTWGDPKHIGASFAQEGLDPFTVFDRDAQQADAKAIDDLVDAETKPPKL